MASAQRLGSTGSLAARGQLLSSGKRARQLGHCTPSRGVGERGRCGLPLFFLTTFHCSVSKALTMQLINGLRLGRRLRE